MKNFYKLIMLAVMLTIATSASANRKSTKQLAPAVYNTTQRILKKAKPAKTRAEIMARHSRRHLTGRMLKQAPIAKNATYSVTGTNLGYGDYSAMYDSYAFAIFGEGTNYGITLWVETKTFAGHYLTKDVDVTYSCLYSETEDFIAIKSVDITTTESANGDLSLKGTIVDVDNNTYNINLSYTKPVKTRTESITITDAELIDATASSGYFDASGNNAAGTSFVGICVYSNTLAGTYVTVDCDDYYTYVASINGKDTVYYDLIDADLTVTMQGADKALITGKLLCQSEVDATDVPEFSVSMTCNVSQPTPAGLDYDATDDDFSYNFTSNDDVLVDASYFAEYNALYIDATSADGKTYLGLEFNVENMDPSIVIPEGVYPIASTYEYGTVTASTGVDEENYIGYSFAGNMDAEGYFVEPMWFMTGGTVTVTNENGKLKVVVDAVNSNGCEVKATISLGGVTPPPSPTPGENIVSNGSFEIWTSDTQPTGWEGWQITDKGNTGGAELVKSTDKKEGSYACLIKANEKNKRLSTGKLTLKAGTYYVQFYAKAVDGTGAIKPGYATKQANGDAKYTYIYGDATVDLTSDWQKILYNFTLEETTDIAMVIMNYKNSGACLIDDYKLWLEGTTPPGPTPISGEIYSIDFTQSMDGWTIDDVNLPTGITYVWKQDKTYGMKASAYVNKTNYAAESWIISPAIDLGAVSSAEMSLNHAVNFTKTPTQFLFALVSTDQRNWDKLTLSAWPAGDGWDYIDATADLSKYAGQKIYIAFCYTSSTSTAPTWEIKNIKVTGEGSTGLPGDSDEDGAVTVADITTTAAYILGKNPNPFNFDNADVDCDKAITVADITGTAAIILGK